MPRNCFAAPRSFIWYVFDRMALTSLILPVYLHIFSHELFKFLLGSQQVMSTTGAQALNELSEWPKYNAKFPAAVMESVRRIIARKE